MAPESSGSAASRRSWSSSGEEGGTPKAVKARRSDGDGSSLSELANRLKASLISDSVAAEMLFSFAIADCRGAFSLDGGAVAGTRRFGGYVAVSATSEVSNDNPTMLLSD